MELLGKVQQFGADVFSALAEGAQVNQVAESFDRLNDSVFQTPDLLEKMRAASRGTIADMDLMRGVLTLVAGTSEETSKRLAESAPQLLEIAKAANKLNPTLGDTAFLYESISTGIKRNSKMILDNLGIVFSTEEAYAAYAESVGKAASELSEAERQQAFLNATMAAGANLIQQVGGDVDAQTDAFEQLATMAKQTGDDIKAGFAEAVAPYLDDIKQSAEEIGPVFVEMAGMAVPSIISIAESLPETIQQIKTFTDSLETASILYKAMSGGATGVDVTFGAARGIKEQIDIIKEGWKELQKIAAGGGIVLPEFDVEAKAQAMQIQILSDAYGSIDPVIANFIDNQRAAATAIADAIPEIDKTAEALDYLYRVSQDVGQATDDIVITYEDMAAAEDKRTQAAEDAAKAAEEQAKALEVAAEAYRELQAASGDYFTQAVANQEDKDYKFDLGAELYKQADAAGASATALALLKLETGDLSEAQAVAALKAAAVAAEIEKMGIAIAAGLDPAAALKSLQDFIDGLSDAAFEEVINPTVTVVPEFVKGDEFDRNFADAFGDEGVSKGIAVKITPEMEGETEFVREMENLFGFTPKGGKLPDISQGVTVEAEVSKALGPIGDVNTAIVNLPTAASDSVVVLQVDNSEAMSALEDVLSLINELPERKTIYIDVEFNATGDEDAAAAAGVEI